MASLGEGTEAPQQMTDFQLIQQCESLVGGVICYRAYEVTDATRTWTRYAAKLTKEGDKFFVELGPEYNYLPQVVQMTARAKYEIPSRGWVYTRIVRASVWVTEFARGQATQIQQLQQQLAAANQNANGQDSLGALLNEINEDGVRLGTGGVRQSAIETDAYTFNPSSLQHDENGAIRIVQYLRAKFSTELAHAGQKHYVTDALNTIQELAMLVPVVNGISGNSHFVQTIKIQLKRLLIAQMIVRGHNTQYISTFSQAVDIAQMPGWVVQAQTTAAAIVKSTQYTMNAKRPN